MFVWRTALLSALNLELLLRRVLELKQFVSPIPANLYGQRVLPAIEAALAALPRPFAWYRIYVLHAAALKQPEVLRVAHRCLAAL